eukprot:EG_transcript_9918
MGGVDFTRCLKMTFFQRMPLKMLMKVASVLCSFSQSPILRSDGGLQSKRFGQPPPQSGCFPPFFPPRPKAGAMPLHDPDSSLHPVQLVPVPSPLMYNSLL